MAKADVVMSLMAIFESGDLEKATAMLADDAVWHAPEQDYVGRDAIVGYVGDSLSGSDEVSMDLHDTLESDSHVVLLGTMHATREGKTFESPYVWVYHVDDGKVSEGWTVAFDGVGRAEFFK